MYRLSEPSLLEHLAFPLKVIALFHEFENTKCSKKRNGNINKADIVNHIVIYDCQKNIICTNIKTEKRYRECKLFCVNPMDR